MSARLRAPNRSTLVWPCWIEVDLEAVRANVRAIQAIAAPRLGVTAVVKAQAYGLGAIAVAKAVVDAGGRGAAVARVAEGSLLRKHGFTQPILVLGSPGPGEEREVVRQQLTATVTDALTLNRVALAAQTLRQQGLVQIKVDTGMTRLGAPQDEAEHLVHCIDAMPELKLEGFYTHFAAADDPDPFFAAQQLARFRSICDRLEGQGFELGMKHAANSAGALRVPNSGLDTVRAGLALSGSYATGWVPRREGLRPAMAFKARIVRLHTPAIGTSIGYGRTFKVFRPMRAALLSVGYADGLPRACSNRGRVLIRGQRAPLIGTVSMDAAMADVTHIPDAAPGDEVVVVGTQGQDEIDLSEFCETAGIIPHEVLVRLGSRVPRLYFDAGRPAAFTRRLEDRLAAIRARGELTER